MTGWIIALIIGLGFYWITIRDQDEWPPTVKDAWRLMVWYCWLLWIPTLVLEYVGPWQGPMHLIHGVLTMPYLLLIAVYLYYWIDWRLQRRHRKEIS